MEVTCSLKKKWEKRRWYLDVARKDGKKGDGTYMYINILLIIIVK